MKTGTVFWITGLSAAGKTTVAGEVVRTLQKRGRSVLLLDGDEVREVFGQDLGYTREDRLRCAMRYSRLCRWISGQGHDVVCATISMFHEVHDWNRKEIPEYIEIFLNVPESLRKKRDQKSVYSKKDTSKRNVVSEDIPAEFPKTPDLEIKIDETTNPKDVCNAIVNSFDQRSRILKRA